MTTREQFRKSFRKYFSESGRTQEELATALGVSRSTVSCWVLGKSFPRADALEAIAKFLNVSVTDLVGYNEFDQESMLIDLYHSMNQNGKDKLIERAKELVLLYGEKSPNNTAMEVIG